MDINTVSFNIHHILQEYITKHSLPLYDKGSVLSMTEFIYNEFSKDDEEWTIIKR
jgi:hypothetical protein